MSQPSENPTYKLYYFDIRGLAEPTRILLAYGGIEYEDVRLSKEEWPALKPTMPMGQLPVLEVDGQRVYQSLSINRYLAKKVGLSGANDWENLLIDIAADTVNDFRLKCVAIHYETDETAKAKKLADFKSETLPFYLEKLDNIAKENNGHLALGKLTWVDIYFVCIADVIKFFSGSDLANYPNLQSVVDNVSSVESIKAWFDRRPKSDF